MYKSSLMNLALRGALISVLIYIFMSVIPSATISVGNKLFTTALVLLFYVIIEYIILYFELPGACATLCGTPSSVADIDQYVNNALLTLKMEQAGPAVQPVLPIQLPQQQPQQPQAPQVVPQAPQVPVLVAPAVQPAVVPTVVPTAAPITPPVPLVQPPQPETALPPPVATSVRTGGGQYF